MNAKEKSDTAKRLRRLANGLSDYHGTRLRALADALEAEADALEGKAPTQVREEQQQVQQQASRRSRARNIKRSRVAPSRPSSRRRA